MKICIDGRPIRDPITGVAAYVLSILHCMRESSCEMEAFVQSNMGKNKYLELIKNYKNICSVNNSFIENIKTELNITPKILKNQKYDIVHETYFSNLPINADFKISTIHDVIPLDFPNFYNFKNRFFSKRNFYRQAHESDLIITVSNYSKSRILNISKSNKKVEVMPLAVSDIIKKNKNSHVGNKNDNFYLVIGNIEPRKNLITAAKAVNLINKKRDNKVKLVSVGREIFKSSNILAEVNDILGDNFKYMGFVSQEEKIKLLQQCKALIMPSSYEGFGIPVIEGHIIGCPVLIANNSSLTELAICKEQLFETFDYNELADRFDSIDHIKDSYKDCDFSNFYIENQRYLYENIYSEVVS